LTLLLVTTISNFAHSNKFNNSINNMVILRSENDGCYRMVSRKRVLRLYNEGKIKLVYSV